MLKIENLKKHYKDFDLDCTLEVKPGCITGLIGANGAGKSTTFKAILGLIDYDGGKIEVLGKTPEELEPEDREKMGVVQSASRQQNRMLSIQNWHPGNKVGCCQCRTDIPAAKRAAVNGKTGIPAAKRAVVNGSPGIPTAMRRTRLGRFP